MGKIYNDPYSSFGHCVGHVSGGIVYDDELSETPAHALGHIDSRGIIYSDPYSEFRYDIAHVDAKGVIYDDPEGEFAHAIAHVDARGILYNDPDNEFNHAVGRVEDGDSYEAAAAYVLLLLGRGEDRHRSSSVGGSSTRTYSPAVIKTEQQWRSHLLGHLLGSLIICYLFSIITTGRAGTALIMTLFMSLSYTYYFGISVKMEADPQTFRDPLLRLMGEDSIKSRARAAASQLQGFLFELPLLIVYECAMIAGYAASNSYLLGGLIVAIPILGIYLFLRSLRWR